MLPYFLYNLTPRDQASSLIRLVNEAGVRVHAGIGPHLELLYTVPAEHVFFMTFAYSHPVAGGAFTAEHEMHATTPVDGTTWRDRGMYYGNIATQYNRTIKTVGSPICIFPELTEIYVTTTPDAAGDAVYWSINGALIPHGTIAMR